MSKFSALGNLDAPQEPQQIDLEDATGKPQQPRPKLSDQIIQAEAKRVATRKTAAPTSTRGKRSNPDYEAVKVLVKTKLRIKAARKWEDQHGRVRDFSDLIEHLLTEYAGA